MRRKIRRQRQRKRQWLRACIVILDTFLHRPLQNSNVKLPIYALTGEREPQ